MNQFFELCIFVKKEPHMGFRHSSTACLKEGILKKNQLLSYCTSTELSNNFDSYLRGSVRSMLFCSPKKILQYLACLFILMMIPTLLSVIHRHSCTLSAWLTLHGCRNTETKFAYRKQNVATELLLCFLG